MTYNIPYNTLFLLVSSMTNTSDSGIPWSYMWLIIYVIKSSIYWYHILLLINTDVFLVFNASNANNCVWSTLYLLVPSADKFWKQFGPRSQQNVWPVLDPNYLTHWWYFWIMKKKWFEKQSADYKKIKHAKLPSRQRKGAVIKLQLLSF